MAKSGTRTNKTPAPRAVPSHAGFTERYRKVKGGSVEDAHAAEEAVERKVAKELGLTFPDHVSGTVMAEAKERYLESL